MSGAVDIERTWILGVGVSAVSLPSAVATVMGWIDRREKHYVTLTSVHGVIEAQDDASFKRTLNGAGLTLPDGMPLVWLSWLAGRSHVTRVYGPDFTLALSQAMGRARKSAFYYGGVPGVAERLAVTLASRFPGLVTAGTYCPPFRPLTPAEEAEVAARISSSGADVVWVGLSTPKQERWMRLMQNRLDAPVLIGVGAAFDFLSGRVRQAPRWIQRSGLEWFYRTTQEPRRLGPRYLRSNPRFVYLTACERLGIRRFDLADAPVARATAVRERDGGTESGVAGGGPPPEADSRAPRRR
jgi:N-acetylglucosaminyldiphosphoundecaprenol N-acetyl-beta-D-mannosaminyltransferase